MIGKRQPPQTPMQTQGDPAHLRIADAAWRSARRYRKNVVLNLTESGLALWFVRPRV